MKTCKFSMRKTVPAIVSFAVALLFFTVSSFATIYYISPVGNDVSGNGTAASPWKTLYKATSVVTAPGDKIYINAGVYTETQQCVLAQGVSIEGAGNTSVIKSTLSGTFQEIISLRSNTEGSKGNQSISYIKMDGNNLTTSWGICVAARSNVSIHHCEFINFRETAVNFSGIVAATGATAPVTYAIGNSFYNNIVNNCSSNTILYGTKYGKGCLQFGGQQDFLCYNNDIQQPQRTSSINDDIGWPIKMANQGHIKGCKVYNNTLKRAPIAVANGTNENWNFCFEMWYIEGGFEMYNNTLQGEVDIANCSKGFPVDAYTFGMKFYNNTSSLPSLSTLLAFGLRLETDESDIEIKNNTFYNLNGGLVFSPFDYGNNGLGINVHRINIHNNLFYNMGKIGGGDIVIKMDNTAVNPQCYFDDFYFDNNTVIAASGNAPFFGIELPAYNGGNTKRIYLRNNHFEGFLLNPVIIGNGSNVSSLYVQNNNFYRNGANSVIIYSGGNPAAYTSTNNTTLDPKLNALYQPMTGSPLIDAGLINGLSYLGTAPDKGFVEYQAALPVKLIEFTVSGNNASNLLQWKTAAEINSSHFIIQRSNNGTDFENIGSMGAAGNSSMATPYAYTDFTPYSFVNYYRLLMVDKDNNKEYSNIVFVKSGDDNSFKIIAANLSSSSSKIDVTATSSQNQKALMQVIDNNGKVFFNEAVVLQKGTNFFSKNIQQAAKGIYYVRLQTGKEATVKNILSSN